MTVVVACLVQPSNNTHPTELVGYGCVEIYRIIILRSH